MRPRTVCSVFTAGAFLIVAAFAGAQSPKAQVKSGINTPFENPDVQKFIKTFENDSREVYAKRAEIVGALGLKPGMSVADVGAGTGLFTRLIAAAVGPEGKVYAEDVAQAFLDHIAAESKRLGQNQVRTIRGDQQSTGLPPDAIDLAFLCDVYHHFEHPAKTLATIHAALRKSGELVVIDFDRVEGKSKPFVLEHVRAAKEVFFAEIESAGFQRIDLARPPSLRENFMARFRKVEKPASPPRRNDR